MSNKDDLEAMNSYAVNRSRPAAGAPASVINRWQTLLSQWKSFYSKVKGSWYVSDADIAQGRSIRNALMKNQDPDSWQYVQETAADKPGRKAHKDRPDAPPPSHAKKPWEQKGLTYSGKHRSKADVQALQKRINAAGYKPPLKVDGKYGPATQEGERWLSLQNASKKAESEIQEAVKPAPSPYRAPPPKPKAAEVPKEPPPVAAPQRQLFGVPLNARSIVGAALGTAAGFAAGGPWGAAIGLPTGFVGGGMFAGEEEEE